MSISNKPYIVCLVPTRGDRPGMLKKCVRMMTSQTLPPTSIVVVDDPSPLPSGSKDITWRYRTGLKRIANRHPQAELVLFIEDDDWYSRSYIEVFYDAWKTAGRPTLFGLEETYYYHLGIRSMSRMHHPKRASAFSTGVTLDCLSMEWPEDSYPNLDIEMWEKLQDSSCTFRTNIPICLGIKGHREGSMFGGIGHNDSWKNYTKKDENLSWFRSIVGDEWTAEYFNFGSGPVGIDSNLGPMTGNI